MHMQSDSWAIMVIHEKLRNLEQTTRLQFMIEPVVPHKAHIYSLCSWLAYRFVAFSFLMSCNKDARENINQLIIYLQYTKYLCTSVFLSGLVSISMPFIYTNSLVEKMFPEIKKWLFYFAMTVCRCLITWDCLSHAQVGPAKIRMLQIGGSL